MSARFVVRSPVSNTERKLGQAAGKGARRHVTRRIWGDVQPARQQPRIQSWRQFYTGSEERYTYGNHVSGIPSSRR
jgi:hypothetical protein